jgi:hypothetical protein
VRENIILLHDCPYNLILGSKFFYGYNCDHSMVTHASDYQRRQRSQRLFSIYHFDLTTRPSWRLVT